VKITAINTATNVRFESTTGKDGSYSIVSLPVGPYQMQIEKPGFKTILKDDLFLHTQDALEVNFQMAVGSTSESVTVNATATNDSPAVSLVITREFIENTPLNGRSLQDLIALAPGTVSSLDGNYSIDGQRNNANYFTVDGVSANTGLTNPQFGILASAAGVLPSTTILGTTQSMVPIDDLQEFRVQTSDYSAEYGRQPGGQLEFTTRSGTDILHGAVFEYLRNEDFDANSFGNNYYGLPRQAERQNIFGGVLGGPIAIPHLLKLPQKTFFFVSYEGTRLLLPDTGSFNVPTTEYRQFASATVQPFLNSAPIANGPPNNDTCIPGVEASCTAQFHGIWSDPSSIDSTSLRVDHSLTSKMQIFARYSNTPARSDGIYASQTEMTTTNSNGWIVGATAQMTHNLVDDLRVNFDNESRNLNYIPNSFGGATPFASSLVLPSQYVSPGTPAFALVEFLLSNQASLGGLPEYDELIARQRQFNILDNLNWNKGNHAIKAGVDFRSLSPTYNPEKYQYYYIFLSPEGVQNGIVDDVFMISGVPSHPKMDNLSLYIADSWKASPRLSLTYGVRWEYNPPPRAAGVNPVTVNEVTNFSDTDLAPAGTPEYRATHDNFAPRFGFAYNIYPSATHAVTLRAGFGIFFDTGQNLDASPLGQYSSALKIASNVALPVSSASSLEPPPVDYTFVPPYSLQVIDPQLRLPYTEQWSISVDTRLSANNVLTASYLGNNGRRLLYTEEYGSINPLFSSLTITNNAASSTYDSLQVQDRGSLSKGLEIIASYSWAHAIDDESADGSAIASYALLRGNSTYDVRQVLNAAINYKSSEFAANKLLRAATRDWLWVNRFAAQSGYPFEVIQGTYFDTATGVTTQIRPDLIAGTPLYLHDDSGLIGNWALNPKAISPVPVNPTTGIPEKLGTLGRNYLRGPNFWSLNAALERQFSIHDHLALHFRADTFNLLNHPNFGMPDNSMSDSTFGQLQPYTLGIGVNNPLYATGAARSLQLALKLQF
jgi:hypothetical protein